MIKERTIQFLRTLSTSADLDCMELTEDLIVSCGEYLNRVIALEAAVLVTKYTRKNQDYKDYIEKLDKHKDTAFSDLRDTIKAVNRICKQYDIPLICEELENDSQIKKFASIVVNEMYECTFNVT